jgi:hypothetical protein
MWDEGEGVSVCEGGYLENLSCPVPPVAGFPQIRQWSLRGAHLQQDKERRLILTDPNPEI